MWKVLEAFLGNSRAQPQHQLVAIELGPLCTKPSPVQFCAAALLNVSAREPQPGPPKRQHRAQAICTETPVLLHPNKSWKAPARGARARDGLWTPSPWLLSSQESEWLHTRPATDSRELFVPLLHSWQSKQDHHIRCGLVT